MEAGGAEMQWVRYRDLLAGVVCVAGGSGVLFEARKYTIGSLDSLGPGFYPAILGALLLLVGVAIIGTALTTMPPPDESAADFAGGPDWRGWSCIVAAVVLFIVCAWLAGLAPAIFACVFVAALGDRTASLHGSLLLALGMSVAGTVLFGYLLGINMPLWQWPWAT
jgi:putative tricarboxylic transport membrane protein